MNFRSFISNLGAVAIATALCHSSVVHAAKSTPDATAGWQMRTASSLQKLTATAPGVLEKFEPAPAHLQAARGEWESFQVVITAGNASLRDVTILTSGFKRNKGAAIPATQVQLFRENYVYIDKPSGNRRLEKLWWPDALIPLRLQPKVDVAAGRSVVFWVAVQVPRNAAPGEYSGQFVVTTGAGRKTVPARLTVTPVTMPPPTMRATVAVYYDVLRDWYAKNAKPQSDQEWAAQKKRFYDFLLDYRINAYDLPVAWSSDEADTYLRDPRVLSVRVPPLGHGEFHVALQKLRKNNVLHKAYYYYIDEPAPQRYAEVRETTQKLRAIEPKLKHLVTVHPNESLKDAVDIWTPNIGDHFGLGHLDLQMLEAERKKGRETWWYTMVEPKNPYPTWLVDDEASAMRAYGLMMADRGISGFVYSMAHGWGPKPLENIQSFAGTNGDGTLLYPSELVGGSGPMPSIRLMLLRDAIEDYELLQLLPKGALKDWPPLLKSKKINWDAFFTTALIVERARALNDQSDGTYFDFTGYPHGGPPIDEELIPNLQNPEIPFADPPTIDGSLNDATWSAHSRHEDSPFFRFRDTQEKYSPTTLYTTHDARNLYIGLRIRTETSSRNTSPLEQWVAVDLAPLDAQERWRFVLTHKGNRVVERHTREGQFRVEGIDWTSAQQRFSGYHDIEIRIPLSVVGNATKFRFNALRRTTHEPSGTRVTLRTWPDAGDTYFMLIATLSSDGLKSNAELKQPAAARVLDKPATNETQR